MNEQEQYYLQESETIVGNCMLFWRKDRKGYTTNLDEAHIFTREEAQAQQRCRETDIPWPKKMLDKVAQRTVTQEDNPFPPGTRDYDRWLCAYWDYAYVRVANYPKVEDIIPAYRDRRYLVISDRKTL